jgi:hypothetical protein
LHRLEKLFVETSFDLSAQPLPHHDLRVDELLRLGRPPGASKRLRTT